MTCLREFGLASILSAYQPQRGTSLATCNHTRLVQGISHGEGVVSPSPCIEVDARHPTS
jgi:hypothetical protein